MVIGWRPRGLRSGVTLAFALGALTLSATLALGTYFSARRVLVEQRERTALRQAYTDAALVRDSLLTSGAQVSDVLGSISPPSGAILYVHRSGRWYSSSLDQPGDRLTAPVRSTTAEGSVSVAWTSATEPHAVVVGIPLPAVNAEYYEVSLTDELTSTLRTLAIALTVCAAFTTVVGALVGRAASRRVLTPLDHVTSAAVKISAGDLEARLGDTRDPDLIALVGAFNHMVDALHERIQQDARFASDVSHELRTPVTTLTTSLSLLERAQGLTPDAVNAVQLMSDEVDRFRRALEDLLTLGRLDAGADPAEFSVTDVDELVRRALIAGRRPVELLRSDPLHAPAISVEVDRGQMLRALTNLFDNADVHAGGVTAVRITRVPGFVDIHVEDQGPGVPADDAERIFERFARAGGAKAGTGSGLGLSIVSETIRRHGGGVWCTNREGPGADFVLRLPTIHHGGHQEGHHEGERA